jgi:pyruvate,water dikinase
MPSQLVLPLAEARTGDCGGKAGTLGVLLRAGFAVPDGVVLPFAAYQTDGLPDSLRSELARHLDRLGDPPVAVRSSAADEDTAGGSAAGQYESVLAVRGIDQVWEAILTCWASLHSDRARSYRDHGPADPRMAILIQRLIDADVSGVMFTGSGPREAIEIEASWGLGPSVVGGLVTPDAYRIEAGSISRRIADKRSRQDRDGSRLGTSPVIGDQRRSPTLDDPTVVRLARIGQQISDLLGGPQDVEWALAGETIWLLQARPVTAKLPPSRTSSRPADLTGTPGSSGTATGTARVVRSRADFSRVRPGDILVCPYTDPAWTPLLRIVAGVITETGGVLSHAAIVAREQGIPAVLGIPAATTTVDDGTTIGIDGDSGVVIMTSP